MIDYLKVYEKFKHTKEVGDYINDVLLLRYYKVAALWDVNNVTT